MVDSNDDHSCSKILEAKSLLDNGREADAHLVIQLLLDQKKVYFEYQTQPRPQMNLMSLNSTAFVPTQNQLGGANINYYNQASFSSGIPQNTQVTPVNTANLALNND